MNNIDLIKEDYKVGDAIRITCELGVKEGTIIDFLEGRIKLRPFSGGKPFYIKEENIGDWEEGFPGIATESSPQNMEIPVNIESQTSQNDIVSPVDAKKPIESQPESNKVDEEKTKPELKILGIIPPEEWEKRGMNKKNKKEGNESSSKEKMKSIGSDLSSLSTLLTPTEAEKVVNNENKEEKEPIDRAHSTVLQPADGQKPKYYTKNQKFKAALGLQPKSDLSSSCSALIKSYEQDEANQKYIYAVGFISADRTQFGFIWDQELQNDIFFSVNDICESYLIDMDNLVGAQVVYRKVFNPSPKNKGKEMAIGICLPHTVAELLALSDSLSDDPRTIQHARDILDTILSQYPSNEDALRLVGEISNKTHCLKSSSVTKRIDEGLLRTFADAKHIPSTKNTVATPENNLPEPEKPDALYDEAILNAITKKRTSMSDEKCRELEKELDSLIRSGKREECLKRSYQILNTACPTPKYYRSYLDRIVNTEIALGHTEEALLSISQLIVYNEMQPDTKKNTLCHLYLSMGRLLFNLGQEVEAKKAIDFAEWLIPGNLSVLGLRNQFGIEKSDVGGEITYNGVVSKMLLQDIQQTVIEVSSEDIKDPDKVYIRARNVNRDDKKTYENRAQLFLHAAAVYLKTGQEESMRFATSVAHYARLKGYSMYNRVSEALLRYPDSRDEVCAYCDSAKSYFLESLGTYSDLNQKAYLQEMLLSYLKLERVISQIQGGKTPDAEWDSGNLKDNMRACLNEESVEEQKVLFRTCIAIGAAAERAWNTLAKDPDGTAPLTNKFGTPAFKENAYKLFNELENATIDNSLMPGVFLHAVFDHRQERNKEFNILIQNLLKWNFNQFEIKEFKSEWQKINQYRNLLLPTDNKLADSVERIITILTPYADRPEIERSRLLDDTQQIILKGLDEIHKTTTYYGRIFFYHIFSNWLTAVQKQIESRRSVTYPRLEVVKETPFIKIKEEKHYISFVICNSGESTADSYRIVIKITDTDIADEITVNHYLIAGQSEVLSWSLPEKLKDTKAISVDFDVFAQYQGKELQPSHYSSTFQVKIKQEFSTGDKNAIPWRISKVPPEHIFKGREEKIDTLVKHYLSPERDWTYIMYGLTRTGKTSILDYLRKRIANKPLDDKPNVKILPFSWDFTNVASYKEGQEAKFWEHLVSTQIYKYLPDNIADKVDASYKNGIFPIDGFGQDDFLKIINILNENSIMPFITIDEFSNVKQLLNGGLLNASFLSILRNLSHEGKACFIYAGTYDIKDLPTDKRYGITGQLVTTRKMEINDIDEASANELIDASQVIEFTDEAKAYIRQLSGCVPYWIQWICLNCGNYAAHFGMWCLGKDEVNEVIASITNEITPNPEIEWSMIDQENFQNNQFSPDAPEEYALLTCIAYLNRENVDNPRGVDIQELSSLWEKNRASEDFQKKMIKAIESMVERKVLCNYQDEDREVYKLNVDLFRRWWYRKHRDLKLYLKQ